MGIVSTRWATPKDAGLLLRFAGWESLPCLWLQTLDRDRRARYEQAACASGPYQCSNGDCRFQFTVTTHTPLHSTKLPLSVWLKGMWLMLQSDKGLSSVRLAEALVVSQPTAWRMGHALRLMAAREHMLDGTVEIDHFHLGGRPRINPDDPPPGRGGKGLPNTQKTPSW